MKILSTFLVSIIAIKALVKSCPISGTYDLTFFVTSSTNDILACSTRSAVNAMITPYSINGPPVMPSIWDSGTDQSNYYCNMTKYFFVPGRTTAVTLDVYSDDYITIKINDVQVTTILTNLQCKYQIGKDVFSYIKPGVNYLYVSAQNTGGQGYFGYRLTINTHFS